MASRTLNECEPLQLWSHHDSLFIDDDSIQNNFTLHVEYQHIAMQTYVTEESMTPERFDILHA
jgi:hypothetical protein